MRARPISPPPREAGFTLLELLVVLAIIGLIVAIAAPRVMGLLSRAKSDTARIQITNLGTALDIYRLDVGHFPTTEEGLGALVKAPSGAKIWNGPYLDKAGGIVDPWGHPYVYRAPGEHGPFDILSLGADGREGGSGEDRDIASWGDGQS